MLGEPQEERAADAVVQEALAELAQADALGPVADFPHAPALHGHPHLPPHALLQPLLPAQDLDACESRLPGTSYGPRVMMWVVKALDHVAERIV